MQALSGSGMSCMSDSWIAVQPAIEEPSYMMPSLNVSSSIVETSVVTCCHLPRGSVKRKSTYFTSLSLIIFKASLAVVIERIPLSCGREIIEAGGSDGVQSGFPGSDPNGFFDVGDEDLAVADPPGLGGATDRLDGFLDHVVAEPKVSRVRAKPRRAKKATANQSFNGHGATALRAPPADPGLDFEQFAYFV